MLRNKIIKFLIISGIIWSSVLIFGIVCESLKQSEAEYLFENYEVDLQELILRNNLSKEVQKWSYCFDTNDEIKKLARKMEVEEIVKWILEFPYDYSQNKSTVCQRATVTLQKNKGICSDKAVLVCSIFYEKGLQCYEIASNKYWHAIALVYYKNKWRPVLTTGYINRNNIDDFMNSLFIISSKQERYFKLLG